MEPLTSISLPVGAGHAAGMGPDAALAPAAPADVRDFAAMMNAGAPASEIERAVMRSATEMSSRYAELGAQWRDFRVDLKDPAAMVHVVDHQASVTSASLHLHFAMHTAEATRSSFHKLFQQQA